MLARLRDIVRKNKLFVRKRKSETVRILVILLTHYGLSYRKVAAILSEKERVSYEAVRQWYHRAGKLFNIERKERSDIAIDETKIKLRKKMALFMGSYRYSHSRDSRRAFNIISLIYERSFISKECA